MFAAGAVASQWCPDQRVGRFSCVDFIGQDCGAVWRNQVGVAEFGVASEWRNYGAFPDFLWTLVALANLLRISTAEDPVP